MIKDNVISVIVPVYNVETYLPACLESICAQTYSDLEIILIDDGSTDHSGALCDEYAGRDSRIRVIHQKNSGAASARNAGLRIAAGEYLAFVDSDDFLEPDAYEFMMEKMDHYHADVVRCGFQDVFTDHEEDRISNLSEKIYTAEEFLGKFTVDWTCGLLWDKLYRRKLFEGIVFEEGHKIDDEFFTYQGIMNAKTILSVPRVVYHYRRRRSGVMSSKEHRRQLVMDKLDYSRERRKRVISAFPDLKCVYDEHYANFLLLLCRDPGACPESLQKTKKQIRDFLQESGPSSPDFRLRLALMRILHTSDSRLMKNREKEKEEADLEAYFK